MSEKEGEEKASPIAAFMKSENKWVALARELIWVAAVVGGIALLLFVVSGTWPAVVTIESESMVPNMKVGDLVFVVAYDRWGDLQSREEGQASGYVKFGDNGDVIVYRPNGASSVHPIIHRAMEWVEPGETVAVQSGKNSTQYTAPSAGYITKGDNNRVIDQLGWMNYRGLGQIEPVKKEYIVGKALFTIPLLGYLPLNIVPVAIIIVAILIVHELYLRRREKMAEPDKKPKKAGSKTGPKK